MMSSVYDSLTEDESERWLSYKFGCANTRSRVNFIFFFTSLMFIRKHVFESRKECPGAQKKKKGNAPHAKPSLR